MKATELIAELQKLINEHGDVPVYKTVTKRDDDDENPLAYSTEHYEIDSIDITIEFAVGRVVVLS
jgi:hypothetical protein